MDTWINPPVNFLHNLTHLEEGLGIYQSNQEVDNALFTIFFYATSGHQTNKTTTRIRQ